MEVTSSAAPGALYLGDGRCRFRVWAPAAESVEVHLLEPRERLLRLEPLERGYHEATAEDVPAASLYLYRLDGGQERPDPASRGQPRGVHGPSRVVDSTFDWKDGSWRGRPLSELVLYEVHVGTFTPEGTFDAVIPRLEALRGLGVTAVELMPVAQFPGDRNWGYDGAYPFAVQDSYGGPEGLKRLVDTCHSLGLAVVLDVVYNHLGPEGNYLGEFGPYFTDRYRTPWGLALNFDGPHSDEVRRFFIENALYWVTDFHIDGLRLDALHAIVDHSAVTFIEELAEAVHRRAADLGRRVQVMAESDLNEARLVRPKESGGYGLDALWNDDFHHALHCVLTEERTGYYEDFGGLGRLAGALREGFVYSGDYSAYRRRSHGSPSLDIPAERFVVFAQNHDQVGNRMLGERLGALTSLEELKLAAAVVLLAPAVPLLFMGEEYGETAPFLYFTSHSDPDLVEGVRRGRREEFAAFAWQGEPPDPQDESTFRRSKLDDALRQRSPHRELQAFYKELLRLRREVPALASLSRERTEVSTDEEKDVLLLRRWAAEGEVLAAFNFGDGAADVAGRLSGGRWRKLLDSGERRWMGKGSSIPDILRSQGGDSVTLGAKQVVLFVREGRHRAAGRVRTDT